MLYISVIIFHIFVCFVLVGVVLLQAGKGAEVGAAFGGSSQTLFGSRGAAPFLSKLTMGAGVLFMVTSLSLSVITKERSVLSSIPTDTEAEAKPASETTSASTTAGTTSPTKEDSEITNTAPTSTPTAVVPQGSSTPKE
ncbi:MAG: preprotein translocase subunit SecG [Nitrospirota bacterium]